MSSSESNGHTSVGFSGVTPRPDADTVAGSESDTSDREREEHVSDQGAHGPAFVTFMVHFALPEAKKKMTRSPGQLSFWQPVGRSKTGTKKRRKPPSDQRGPSCCPPPRRHQADQAASTAFSKTVPAKHFEPVQKGCLPTCMHGGGQACHWPLQVCSAWCRWNHAPSVTHCSCPIHGIQ